MVLGFTRTGIAVHLPTRRSPGGKFFGWTRGDHVDASRILVEHGEREHDADRSRWCRHWAKIHRAVAKTAPIRTGTETVVRSRRSS